MVWDKLRSNLLTRPSAGQSSLGSGSGDTLPPLPDVLRSQPSLSDAAWQKACEIYLHSLSAHPELAPCAACAEWGQVHLELAELLWDQRHQMSPQEARRVVYVSTLSVGLMAVYSPDQRLVQLRAVSSAFKHSGGLAMNPRLMPASAKLLEGVAAEGFQTLPFTLLMWHYGQTSALALSHLPSLLGKRLFLRRFPSLAPNVLQLRHLRLMHALSREPYRFEDIADLLLPEDRAYICPDLTSLYFTGALQIKTKP